ncbi:phosphatidylserine decarboxylase [Nitratifractor sp.]|uniref:phosphatidylserine decarboxylase n=1 Tax=Nitratifractor sp. TaxID=2268144 RepID=UPI0025DB05DA|nr:phosphatidylserine decarboxylase [Nitratifractor sp.]
MAKRHWSAAASALFGRFALKRFPRPVQRIINRGYVRMMGLEMGEFRAPESYESLNALFIRALEAQREIASDPDVVISPCDARITDVGRIVRGQAYQIKGMPYRTAGLLGEAFAEEASALERGAYANFYLSPRDYHRYHAPFDLEVEAISHIPGKLYPVNMPLLKNKIDLFLENERVVLAARDRHGRRHFLVLVGALNVGKMVVTFEERIHTNTSIRQPQHYRYATPVPLKKGELFGWFEMGSTIVILSEAESLEWELDIGEKVRFAQSVGRLLEKGQ